MAYSNTELSDDALDWWLTVDVHLWLCSAEPSTYAQATTTYGLARFDNALAITGPVNASPNGRKLTIGPITSGNPGNVLTSGTATHWAVVDVDNVRLIYANAVASPLALTAGSTFTLPAFDVRLPAATSAA